MQQCQVEFKKQNQAKAQNISEKNGNAVRRRNFRLIIGMSAHDIIPFLLSFGTPELFSKKAPSTSETPDFSNCGFSIATEDFFSTKLFEKCTPPIDSAKKT